MSWRWLCTECWTEGTESAPEECPTCGCDDAWYQTNVEDERPMTEVYASFVEGFSGRKLVKRPWETES